jgi:hypothetical protein
MGYAGCLTSMKAFFVLLLISLGMQANSQSSLFDSVNRKRYQLAQSGFLALGGWAAANISAGLIGQGTSSGEEKQFYRANTIGGFVNLAFAAIGYLSSRRMASQPHDVAKTYQRQELTEKLFLFSVGLDIGTMAYGLYTRERANRFTGDKRDWLKGAGNTLLLQGGFLILFDGVMYLLQSKNGKRLHGPLQNLSLSASEKGVGLSYEF